VPSSVIPAVTRSLTPAPPSLSTRETLTLTSGLASGFISMTLASCTTGSGRMEVTVPVTGA
jgi:hypothetical protein